MSDFYSFQFHEGPIKTVACAWVWCVHGWFQFHEGPIKTMTTSKHIYIYESFNSMKVRLKLEADEAERVYLPFQFHEGPIKTYAIAYEDYTTPAVSIP